MDRRGDRVGHVGEATRLPPVADHRDRLAPQRLSEEDRDHAPDVDGVEPWAVYVEVTHDRDLESHLGVREAEVLADRLRGRVAPAIDPRGAEHAVIVFAPWNLRVAAVHFGGRRE